MSFMDDMYNESVHDWLDEREPPEQPSPDEYEDEPCQHVWVERDPVTCPDCGQAMATVCCLCRRFQHSH